MTKPQARELTIARVFNVPARYLFLAYSQPEHIKRWFGPEGWPVTKAEMDFRQGGTFRFQMTGPDGEKGPPFGGQYLEIVPNEKIVYDNGFDSEDDKMIVTVTFAETDGKTLLTMHTLFPSDEMAATHIGGGMEEGVQSGFDQLERLVAELSV